MSGRFQVEDLFTISGRGPVALGDVLEGTIRIGMHTQALSAEWPCGLRVVGVEIAHGRSDGDVWHQVGLLFEGIEATELGRLLPEDRVLVLRPATESSSSS